MAQNIHDVIREHNALKLKKIERDIKKVKAVFEGNAVPCDKISWIDMGMLLGLIEALYQQVNRIAEKVDGKCL
jgi:hypothetical protein